jgi:mono/diheme cytochrome c family protein
MRIAFRIAVLGALIVVCQSADAKAAQAGAQGNEGRALFGKYCASCHGASARGDGPAADALKARPGDLTQFAKRNGGIFPVEKTRRLIDGHDAVRSHGSVEMPVWGDAFQVREGLTESAAKGRVEAIMYYLQSIQEKPRP